MNESSPLPELPAVGFLAEVAADHRAFLAGFGQFLRPGAGETVIAEGEPQPCLHLILSGTLHVVAAADSRPLLIASLGAGDALGEVNVFDPAAASATVIARSPSLIWRITDRELTAFLSADPEGGIQFLQGLLQLAAKRIRAMNDKLIASEERSAFHNFWKANE